MPASHQTGPEQIKNTQGHDYIITSEINKP